MTDQTATQTSQSSPAGASQSTPAAASAAALPGASASNPATVGSQSQTGQVDSGTSGGQQQQTQAPSRPAYVPDTFWDAKANKITDEAKLAEWINENVAFKAAEDSRKLTLPAKPEDYKAELPKDFVTPDGTKVEFKDTDPLFIEARKTAKDMGLTQEQFSRLLSLHAGAMVNNQQTFKTARDAEIAKLGPTAPARISAIQTWLKAVAGPDAATLIGVLDYAPVAGTVKAFENLISRYSSQGAGGFSQSHREPGEQGGRLTEEQYSALPIAQRLDYARSHANGRA